MDLHLVARQSPGDVMAMTAAVESLHRQFPNEYKTSVDTPAMEIWENNPHVADMSDEATVIDMEYPAIHQSNTRPVRCIDSYTEYLADKLQIPLKQQVSRPCLYLKAEERGWIDQVRQYVTGGKHVPFWVVNAGIKGDYTAKSWPVEHYQEVVDKTRGVVQWVQIGSTDHNHPELRGVINLVGKTTHRELIRLVWNCEGGLGPITYLQHLCAAFSKPYLALVGGREPMTWVQYPTQHTFHSAGSLWCCKDGACWKSRTVREGDGDKKDESLCEWPVLGLDRPAPKCMASITPNEILSVLRRIA